MEYLIDTMPKGIPKNGVNKGWFKHGHKIGNRFEKGNKLGFQKGIHPEFEFKKGCKKPKNAYSFPKGHHPKTEFKKDHLALKNEKHPNWQNGKSFEPYTIDWTESLRRSIRERDHYICQLCSKQQGDRVHSVHHIDYDKKNCDPTNLITLCVGCNTKVNYNRNRWIKYLKQKWGM